jgi:hypothetical protein
VAVITGLAALTRPDRNQTLRAADEPRDAGLPLSDSQTRVR